MTMYQKDMVRYTPLKIINIAPENRGPLEKEIPIGNHQFQVQTVSFRECIQVHTLLLYYIHMFV